MKNLHVWLMTIKSNFVISQRNIKQSANKFTKIEYMSSINQLLNSLILFKAFKSTSIPLLKFLKNKLKEKKKSNKEWLKN
jgi:hypothetical protein